MNHNNLFLFKHTILQSHSIIYGGRHLWKQAWDTLRWVHVISQNFMQNFSFCALQMASSKRFCETTASPNAHQVKNADHEFTRQKCHFCSISCAFHIEWWSARFLLYLGMITSQAYPHLEAYPILQYPSKYRYVPKNGRFDQFPQLNLLNARKAHRRQGNTNSCQHVQSGGCGLWGTLSEEGGVRGSCQGT